MALTSISWADRTGALSQGCSSADLRVPCWPPPLSTLGFWPPPLSTLGFWPPPLSTLGFWPPPLSTLGFCTLACSSTITVVRRGHKELQGVPEGNGRPGSEPNSVAVCRRWRKLQQEGSGT